MTRDDAINELKFAIDLIKQDGKDWLDERDIPLLQMAIEALERKNGRWTKKEEYLDTPTVCTLCGHEYVEYVEGWEWEETGDLPNYCPHCGADMRGDEDDKG